MYPDVSFVKMHETASKGDSNNLIEIKVQTNWLSSHLARLNAVPDIKWGNGSANGHNPESALDIRL